MAVQQFPDFRNAAFGQEPSTEEQEDPVRELGDFSQDVAGDEDADPALGHAAQEVHELEPGLRVEAVEGLVEDEDLGLVQEGLGQPDALAHALGHGREGQVRPGVHAREDEAPGHGLVQGGALEPGEGAHHAQPPVRAEARREAVSLGHEADAGQDPGIAVGSLPEDPHLAARRGQKAGEELDEAGLAGAIGSQEPGDPAAGFELEGGGGEPQDVAVAEGGALEGDQRTTSLGRVRRTEMNVHRVTWKAVDRRIGPQPGSFWTPMTSLGQALLRKGMPRASQR